MGKIVVQQRNNEKAVAVEERTIQIKGLPECRRNGEKNVAYQSTQGRTAQVLLIPSLTHGNHPTHKLTVLLTLPGWILILAAGVFMACAGAK